MCYLWESVSRAWMANGNLRLDNQCLRCMLTDSWKHAVFHLSYKKRYNSYYEGGTICCFTYPAANISSVTNETAQHMLKLLFFSLRVVLFICLWVWVFSACCWPGLWCRSATSIWPEPGPRPAECSQLWIPVNNAVFSRPSACASCLRLCDEQHSAPCVWTAVEPTTGFWLWHLQCWWVLTILFLSGLTESLLGRWVVFLEVHLKFSEWDDFCLLHILNC